MRSSLILPISSSRKPSNLTGFLGIFLSRASFSAPSAMSTGPEARLDAGGGRDDADARTPAPTRDARRLLLAAPAPRAVAGRADRSTRTGDVDGEGLSDPGADGATAPPFSTCAAAADLSAGGSEDDVTRRAAPAEPARRITSSTSFPPAALAPKFLSARPDAAAATTLARSSSVTATSSPDTAVRIQASASDLPSPLIFPETESSTNLSAAGGRVLARPAAALHASSAPAAAARTDALLSPNCLTISGTSPWPWRLSPTAGPIAAATAPTVASAFAARLRLASANLFASEGIRSPVLGAMRLADSARISFTASTAAARTFQLGSPISLISFSVILPETSARGKPPSAAATDVPSAAASARTFRAPSTTGPTYGLRANSASNVLSWESLRSARKSFSPGPRPACMAPRTLPAADLHAGLDMARALLHHEMAKATSTTATVNSPIAPAHHRSDSAVTFGFTCVAVRL